MSPDAEGVMNVLKEIRKGHALKDCEWEGKCEI